MPLHFLPALGAIVSRGASGLLGCGRRGEYSYSDSWLCSPVWRHPSDCRGVCIPAVVVAGGREGGREGGRREEGGRKGERDGGREGGREGEREEGGREGGRERGREGGGREGGRKGRRREGGRRERMSNVEGEECWRTRLNKFIPS